MNDTKAKEEILSLEEKTKLLDEQVSNQRKRVSSDRIDISFGELINLYKNDELVIRPEYQRLFRWSPQQKTALIESILLSIPIPPIFVSEDKNGIWELVDGMQRVSTFLSFFGELKTDVSKINYLPTSADADTLSDEIDIEDEIDSASNEEIGNKWILSAGGLLKNLEGFNIDSLPNNLKINLKRAVCRVEILRGESNAGMKYELFKRLNSGGSKLTAQEIRNAIYRGISTKLNELILELSQSEVFRRLTNLSPTKIQELYDQELVLRFIAFLNNSNDVNENTENFLNNFMEKAVNNTNFDYEMYKISFLKVMDLIDSIGDVNILRSTKNIFSPTVFEGITIATAQNFDRFKDAPTLLASKILELKRDEEFRKFSGTGSNSRSRTKSRLQRADVIFRS